jgi:CHASE2 domain-containing sensor protein
MIDSVTEAKLGAFPIDRAHIANSINILSSAGAKAVVLKFFYDQPSNEKSDAALQAAIVKSTAKILLQARIDDAKQIAR